MMHCFKYIFLLAAVSYGTCSDFKTLKLKYGLIKRESANAEAALQSITSDSPGAKLRIDAIANEFGAGLGSTIYLLNTIVPNLDTASENYQILSAISTQLIEGNYALLQTLHKDFNVIKNQLVDSLEKIKNGIDVMDQVFKVPNELIRVQLSRKDDYFLYAIYKLKYQALLFNKTNKQLAEEISAAGSEFTTTLRALPDSDQALDEELRRLLYHLSVVVERVVYKLENWVELNKGDHEAGKSVREISVFLGKLYGTIVQAVENKKLTVSHLKTELANIYETGTKENMKIAEIVYADKLTGEENIRSSLFDSITVAREFTDILKTITAGSV